jgi:triacylglycerol esterase/lipase EstA (alpha/beta hydrolase family)
MKSIKKPSLNIVAHSMGGLIARSACYYAKRYNHNWLPDLNKIIFLGTPHHGAILAKGGHWTDLLLQISPYSAPFAKITKVRSSGLTDLRNGSIVDEDWQNEQVRKIIPLPKNVNCYAIATITSENKNSKIANNIVGDGLVTINSALGKHKDLNLNIPEANQWIGKNISHIQLLSDKNVYEVIENWLRS